MGDEFDPQAEWRCPAPRNAQMPCMSRLPCEAHGVADVNDGADRYGSAVELREGEIALHLVVRA